MSAIVEKALAGDAAAAARRRWAARFLFFGAGLLFATWGVHIPTVKGVYGLEVGALGALILAAGIGALIGLTQAGWLIGRFGARRVAWLGGAVSALTIALLLAMPGYVALWVLLAVYGASSGLLDVAMNAYASELEVQEARPLMSGFHAMFSLGGMAGAAIGSVVLQMAADPRAHIALVAVFTTAGFAWSMRQIAPPTLAASAAAARHERFTLPRGRWLLLGLMAGLGFIVEGSIYDWSVLFVRTERGAAPEVAALAYAAFSATMALTRFGGDWLRARYSPATLLIGSALLAGSALALVLLTPQVWVALVGFALVGVGLANVVPVLFSAAANVPGKDAAQGISAVASIGYLGFMVGPSVIGFVAQHQSLPVAMGLMVVCAAVLAVAAPRGLKG
jgi:fucose permease